MRPYRLFWQIYPAFLGIILLTLLVVTLIFSDALRDFFLTQTAADLKSRAILVRSRLTDLQGEELNRMARNLGLQTETRYTLVAKDGRVLGDTREDPSRMDNHADRPEVAAALKGQVGTAVRFSGTLQKEMMYVAIPIETSGTPSGAVRAAVPTTRIDSTLREIFFKMAAGSLAAVVLSALLSLFVTRRISLPLEKVKRGAELFARGDLGKKLEVRGSAEIRSLADTMNRMAAHLDDRIRTVLRQRNEQEAVLSSMVEGVLAVDSEGRILRINRAAARLLRLNPEAVQGRRIQEVLRKADLQRFIARVLDGRKPLEGDLVLRDSRSEHFLQAHGTPLRGAHGQEIGVLVVLNDVTRLRRLENVRRDFVANVSHELKTPITAIKGSVETLLDGAVEDPAAARRFLEIVHRQSDRLNAIIEDLLALSRLEQEDDEKGISLEDYAIGEVLRSAVHACIPAAEAKSIRIELFCPRDLKARINPPLLEQAVVNLIDNAVKYSPPESRVQVEAAKENQEVRVSVRDWGRGIEQKHLSRLFERFYRADKARSRKEGGTGLGLAIVKHIAQAHGGSVEVASTPGKGSTFTIRLVLP